MNESQSDPVIGRVVEAFLERYRKGERPSLSEYTEKHSEAAEQLRELLPALVVMEELGSVDGPPLDGTGPAPKTSQVPQQLGDYRILREVGRGGMGIVYEAVQLSLGRHVALKVLSSHSLLPGSHLVRFHREARAAARLHHSNIVPVYSVGEHENVHYYVMQFIQGQALDDVLNEVKRLRSMKGAPSPAEPASEGVPSFSLAQALVGGAFAGDDPPASKPRAAGRRGQGAAGPTLSSDRPVASPPAAESDSATGLPSTATGPELTSQPDAQYYRGVAQMGVQIANGLDYAHKEGILHRDIKPSNLLLDAKGTVWITDFGLAKAEGADELTHTGDVVGTLRYMAPERFNGWSDPRSDDYGLGITLYELLTLHPAFTDASRLRLIERITHEDPVRPRRLDRAIPRDLETIVLKAIHKEAGRRYQTAADLATDLTAFLAGRPVRARRISVWGRTAKWIKRQPAIAALLAVSASALAALIVGIVIHNATLEDALQEAQTNLQKARTAEGHAMSEAARNRRLLYSADVLMASQAWQSDEGTVAQCNALLLAHVPGPGQPDLREFCWRYQWRLLYPASVVRLPSVPRAAGVAAGERVVTLDGQGRLRAWPIGEPRKCEESTLGEDGLLGVTLARNGEVAAVIDRHGAPKVFDVGSGSRRVPIRAPAAGLVSCT